MKNQESIFEFFKNSKKIKFMALAIFLSNIGSGMQLIAVSRLLYDRTNSATSIGVVLILQYVVMFLVQFISGTIVDKKNQRNILILCDLIKGLLIVGVGILFFRSSNASLFFLYLILVLFNFVAPFFSNAQFTLIPKLVQGEDELLQANSIITTLFQAGQLIGSASVASIIYFLSPSTALIISGSMFLLSSFCFNLIKYKKEIEENTKVSTSKFSFFEDWKYVIKEISREKSLLAHLLISSGDYMAVNIFNLMLIPLVAIFYNNNSLFISLFDSGFAIGAMIVVTFVTYLSKRVGTNNSAVIGLFAQSLILILLTSKLNVFLTFILMILYGSANSFSITIFNTNLQKRTTTDFMGRINSVKNFIVSLLTISLVPFLSKAFDVSVEQGLITSGVVLFVYSLVSFLFGRNFLFGKNYLKKAIQVKNLEDESR
ncbi:MFS transporter [Enterococcus plantarum]|uniref:MFS transporter n=1 Tax=Enterococcus plantarum TaxID=1077675 RepID=UPI001A8FA6CE|nr:MFS transporter [Enterococcus plantarum]MBO0468534.1 MFS transporter [Enterococcus plantarum]